MSTQNPKPKSTEVKAGDFLETPAQTSGMPRDVEAISEIDVTPERPQPKWLNVNNLQIGQSVTITAERFVTINTRFGKRPVLFGMVDNDYVGLLLNLDLEQKFNQIWNKTVKAGDVIKIQKVGKVKRLNVYKIFLVKQA